MKNKFAFFEASQDPIPKRRNLLAKRPLYKQKGPCLKRPLNWTGSVFPLLKSLRVLALVKSSELCLAQIQRASPMLRLAALSKAAWATPPALAELCLWGPCLAGSLRKYNVIAMSGPPPPKGAERNFWKATKEYLNQRGTKIRVFRVCFRAPLLPPFSLIFPPLFPLQALFTLPPLLPSSPSPSSLLSLAPGKV